MNIDKDKLIEMAKEAAADFIDAGERIDQLYEGERTLYAHYLFSENELAKFADLVSAHAITSMQESILEKCTSEPTNQLLENWLNINMPAGTEIGDPKWWAIRIRNVLSLEAVSQKFTNKDADTIGLIASREIMNVLVDAGVILFTSNKPQLQAKIQCAVINAISQPKGDKNEN